MVCFCFSFHLLVPLASLLVPGKPNFREKERLPQPHDLLHKKLGLVLKTKSTNKNRIKDDYWTAEVSLVGWGHGAWASDENCLPSFLLSVQVKLPSGDGSSSEPAQHICNWVNGIWTCLICLSQYQWAVTVTEHAAVLDAGQKQRNSPRQQGHRQEWHSLAYPHYPTHSTVQFHV